MKFVRKRTAMRLNTTLSFLPRNRPQSGRPQAKRRASTLDTRFNRQKSMVSGLGIIAGNNRNTDAEPHQGERDEATVLMNHDRKQTMDQPCQRPTIDTDRNWTWITLDCECECTHLCRRVIASSFHRLAPGHRRAVGQQRHTLCASWRGRHRAAPARLGLGATRGFLVLRRAQLGPSRRLSVPDIAKEKRKKTEEEPTISGPARIARSCTLTWLPDSVKLTCNACSPPGSIVTHRSKSWTAPIAEANKSMRTSSSEHTCADDIPPASTTMCPNCTRLTPSLPPPPVPPPLRCFPPPACARARTARPPGWASASMCESVRPS
eukprot:3578757-Rhodomonas_salina.1